MANYRITAKRIDTKEIVEGVFSVAEVLGQAHERTLMKCVKEIAKEGIFVPTGDRSIMLIPGHNLAEISISSVIPETEASV